MNETKYKSSLPEGWKWVKLGAICQKVELEQASGSAKNELVALVSPIRKVSGLDAALTPFEKTVDKNFQDWVFKKQAGTLKFTEEQMHWLRMIKDFVARSFHVDREDFELDPFNKKVDWENSTSCSKMTMKRFWKN